MQKFVVIWWLTTELYPTWNFQRIQILMQKLLVKSVPEASFFFEVLLSHMLQMGSDFSLTENYLNQFWLIFRCVLWYSPKTNFTVSAQVSICKIILKNTLPQLPGAKELICEGKNRYKAETSHQWNRFSWMKKILSHLENKRNIKASSHYWTSTELMPSLKLLI